MLRRIVNRIVIAVLLTGSLELPGYLCASPCDEQDGARPVEVVASTLLVTVPEIESSLNVGRDAQTFALRLIIDVNVENSSNAAQTMDPKRTLGCPKQMPA